MQEPGWDTIKHFLNLLYMKNCYVILCCCKIMFHQALLNMNSSELFRESPLECLCASAWAPINLRNSKEAVVFPLEMIHQFLPWKVLYFLPIPPNLFLSMSVKLVSATHYTHFGYHRSEHVYCHLVCSIFFFLAMTAQVKGPKQMVNKHPRVWIKYCNKM